MIFSKHSSESRTYVVVSTDDKVYKIRLPEEIKPNDNEQAAAWYKKYLPAGATVRSCTAFEEIEYMFDNDHLFDPPVNEEAKKLQLSMEDALNSEATKGYNKTSDEDHFDEDVEEQD